MTAWIGCYLVSGLILQLTGDAPPQEIKPQHGCQYVGELPPEPHAPWRPPHYVLLCAAAQWRTITPDQALAHEVWACGPAHGPNHLVDALEAMP